MRNIIVRIICMLIVGLCISANVFASSYPLKLSWNTNASEDSVIGYRVYASEESRNYTINDRVADIAEGEEAEIQLEEGVKWYLIVTAYNTYGESGWSNEVVEKVGPPGIPTGFKVKITVIVEIES